MNTDQLKTKLMQFTGELKRQWDKFNYNEPKMPSWRSEETPPDVLALYGDKRSELK